MKKQIVFVTKYALTSGVWEVEAEVYDDFRIGVESPVGTLYFTKKQWCANIEHANDLFEDMKYAKKYNLKQQLVKLDNMEMKIIKK